ncbi:Beta-glucuronosyltransferase GlcAT14A [Linum grandiflorum]
MQMPPSSPRPTTPTTPGGKDNSTRTTTISVILATSFFSLLFIFSLSSSSSSSSSSSQSFRIRPDPRLFPTRQPTFSKIPSDPAPPSIAYLISGSKGDSNRILRLLFAIYHPKNHYLLHLDLSAPSSERDGLSLAVDSSPVFRAAQNVDVIGKSDFAYQRGSSPVSATLHGAALLLKLSNNWDWFVSLGAADYPLVTQDDLLHIFSYLPKDLNFVSHSSYIGWKESRRLKPIIVDPGLYLAEKSYMFHATQRRPLPTSFRLFTGSSFSVLSRNFIEHCIVGTDNLPRILLMYFSNTMSSITSYFHTVLCNSPQFNRTVINQDLQYKVLDQSFRQEPRLLNSSDLRTMIRSGAAFASQFKANDPVLGQIDSEILRRSRGEILPGGWCLGDPANATCSVWGDANVLRPGKGAARLERLIVKILSNGKFRSQQCIVE